jgi:putative transposase
VTRFIEVHRDRWGVEPICRVLQVAPSTYYAASSRPPSARALRDAQLKVEIERVYKEHFEVYGACKVWRQLHREGIVVGRDRVARLMRELGIAGVVRGRPRRTTIPAQTAEHRPADLVNRDFSAPAPNRLWVADLTYVATWAGFAYVALVIDAFSRMIVGWRVATTLRATLALDALEMAIWARRGGLDGLVHHSDRGGQYLAIRYTQRLAEEGAVASVGSRGDSDDNALAEAVNGLYKAELIRRQGPWRTADQVELATLEWVSWWNQRRLHGAIGDIPPAEYEAIYYRQHPQSKEVA